MDELQVVRTDARVEELRWGCDRLAGALDARDWLAARTYANHVKNLGRSLERTLEIAVVSRAE